MVEASSGGSTQPRHKVIVCGAPSSADNGLWDPRCGTPRKCPSGEAFATLTLVNGVWTNPVVWCPSTGTPAQIADAIRAQAIRLLPHVRIGIAPPDAVTLVNIQTILWADTPADRALPAATVLGRRVELRIHLVGADWNYGDGTRDSSTGPGKAYDDAGDPCHTAQCPDYAGHTYVRTGNDTITLTTRWHAEYSLDAGANWHDIAGALTAPSSSQTVTVKQARAVLVPNPGDH